MRTDLAPQPAIIFLHIPKTGGVTLRNILRRLYPGPLGFGMGAKASDEREVELEHRARIVRHIRGEGAPPPTRLERNEVALEQLGKLPPERMAEIQMFLGHVWFGIHKAIPKPTTYITMLRDPVERVLSLYNHRLKRHDLRMSLEEYVRAGRDYPMNNEQVRRLFGSGEGLDDIRLVECTEEKLEAAKRHIHENFAVVGLTERFDESLVLMAHRFGWKRIHYKRDNVSGERTRAPDIDPAIRNLIEAANAFDIELYAYAKKLVDERVAGDPEMARELRRLRLTSSAYARLSPVTEALERSGVRRKVTGAASAAKRSTRQVRRAVRKRRNAVVRKSRAKAHEEAKTKLKAERTLGRGT